MTQVQTRSRRGRGAVAAQPRRRLRGEDGDHPGLRKARLRDAEGSAPAPDQVHDLDDSATASQDAKGSSARTPSTRPNDAVPSVALRWAKMRLALLRRGAE